MSSTYRQVEKSRAASRVGSRAGSPGPGDGGNGAARLRLVEARVESGMSGQGKGDVNEQVFRELNRRACGLGAVWLDGVSVSSSGTDSVSS